MGNAKRTKDVKDWYEFVAVTNTAINIGLCDKVGGASEKNERCKTRLVRVVRYINRNDRGNSAAVRISVP